MSMLYYIIRFPTSESSKAICFHIWTRSWNLAHLLIPYYFRMASAKNMKRWYFRQFV